VINLCPLTSAIAPIKRSFNPIDLLFSLSFLKIYAAALAEGLRAELYTSDARQFEELKNM